MQKRQRAQAAIDMRGHSWILLIGAVVLIANAVHGLVTGKASLAVAPYKRTDNPYAYWIAIVFSSVLGLGGLVTFVYTLFR